MIIRRTERETSLFAYQRIGFGSNFIQFDFIQKPAAHGQPSRWKPVSRVLFLEPENIPMKSSIHGSTFSNTDFAFYLPRSRRRIKNTEYTLHVRKWVPVLWYSISFFMISLIKLASPLTIASHFIRGILKMNMPRARCHILFVNKLSRFYRTALISR